VDADQVRERFDRAEVARLATVDQDGRPHLVPITFARLDPDILVSAVDHKPKRTTRLRRLANIAAHPAVTVLVDHYEDDWQQLWWARADGTGEIRRAGANPDERTSALRALAARYPQYLRQPPTGPLIVIRVERWSGWEAGSAPVRPSRMV
jgi:PPOX class probable F420-dependent enzyme